ncbi:MAG: COX15/CtaA family protein [Polyangiaceae bacterium]
MSLHLINVLPLGRAHAHGARGVAPTRGGRSRDSRAARRAGGRSGVLACAARRERRGAHARRDERRDRRARRHALSGHELHERASSGASTGAHLLLRLRVLHPLFAVVTAALVVGTSTVARAVRPTPAVTRLSRVVAVIVTGQLGLGVLNVGLLAPIWLQLVHLFAADVLFVAFVLLWAETRGVGYERSTTRFRPPRFAS